jgi:hypothetical protein
VAEVDGEGDIRRFQRIYFEFEEEINYTRGPVRITSVSDGIEDNCAALLLNLRFSDSIKTAIRMQRELDNEIQERQRQDAITKTSLARLEESLGQYNCRRLELVRAATRVGSEAFVALEKELPEINKKIGELEILMSEETNDQQRRQTKLNARYKASCEAQRMVNRHLESALFDAKPMPAQSERATDTPSSEGRFTFYYHENSKRLEKEHVPQQGSTRSLEQGCIQGWPKAYAGQSDTVLGKATVRAGGFQASSLREHAPMDFEPVVHASEYDIALNLHKEYVATRNRRCDAGRDHHNHDNTSNYEHHADNHPLRNSGGIRGTAQKILGLRWMKRVARHRREIRDAQDDFQKARAAAIKGGWVLDSRIDDPKARSVCDYHPVHNIPVHGAPLEKSDGSSASQEAVHQAGRPY